LFEILEFINAPRIYFSRPIIARQLLDVRRDSCGLSIFSVSFSKVPVNLNGTW
jgi:hypothetical protein